MNTLLISVHPEIQSDTDAVFNSESSNFVQEEDCPSSVLAMRRALCAKRVLVNWGLSLAKGHFTDEN